MQSNSRWRNRKHKTETLRSWWYLRTLSEKSEKNLRTYSKLRSTVPGYATIGQSIYIIRRYIVYGLEDYHLALPFVQIIFNSNLAID
jgi:hypothetical protein